MGSFYLIINVGCYKVQGQTTCKLLKNKKILDSDVPLKLMDG